MRWFASILMCWLALAIPAWAGFDEDVAAYERGDYESALKEFRSLAESDHAEAQAYLRQMYDQGKSVPQDWVEATERLAAKQGVTVALVSLGKMHAKGRGVPQDYIQAHMWFNLAAAQGNESAAENRDQIAEKLSPADVLEAQRMARVWRSKYGRTYLEIETENAELREKFAAANSAKAEIELTLVALNDSNDQLADQLTSVRGAVDRQRAARVDLAAGNERLNRQLADIRDQLSRMAAALALSETEKLEQKFVIGDLEQKLTEALVNRVEVLQRYRSEFFGKLRAVLGERPDVRVVGDRFVFQSEVLFASGSAELEPAGQAQLGQLAETLKSISATFPPDLPWVLRIDGHTDNQPISTPQFPSNWELSTGRAISVVRFLIHRGIAADRLVAAGFGEHQPLDRGEDEIGYRRNRRIEIKLTRR